MPYNEVTRADTGEAGALDSGAGGGGAQFNRYASTKSFQEVSSL